VDDCPYGRLSVYARVRLGFCAIFTDPLSYLRKGKEHADTVLSLSDVGLRSSIVYRHFFPFFRYPFFPYLGENLGEQIFEMVIWLKKPWLASLYLSAPYLIVGSEKGVWIGRRRMRFKLS